MPDNKWVVVVRKGRPGKSLRKINAMCKTCLTKDKAKQAAKESFKILFSVR